MDSKPYKSDPIYNCNISLENESFMERFKCTVIQPLRMLSIMYPILNQLNDLRNQLGAEPVFVSSKRLAQSSLIFIDTFFGFEVK